MTFDGEELAGKSRVLSHARSLGQVLGTIHMRNVTDVIRLDPRNQMMSAEQQRGGVAVADLILTGSRRP
jgi:hypothetical protein